MWANAQRDGRPAQHRWRPLFNAAKFGLLIYLRVNCSIGRLQLSDSLHIRYDIYMRPKADE